MGQSYRIRTKLGENRTINVQLDQDFEFLEVLSLKLQQSDVYDRSCADHGVIIGRVIANGGLGVPNAKVSVFVPVREEDVDNPKISQIYPYKNIDDVNEDGYKYNILPYEKSYSKHTPVGTFPSRNDVLIDEVASEIYDKYYRYTVKTNNSGDYMITGVPTGSQQIILNLDLSDMGEFSLSPQDLVRMGIATEEQIAGGTFEQSENFESLPQIITLSKNLEVSPLWGDESICQIAVNRVDFDLRAEANIDIQPTAVFLGSMFSASDKYRVRKNSKPKDNLGNLCQLEAGPGQILSIRQTMFQDDEGNPILEEYKILGSGNVIDENGTWMIDLPMNLDYIITNEEGEKIISNNPNIGIPTKAKYRFKIKWSQPKDLTSQVRRGYYLVPNVKEYGWSLSSDDPNYSTNNNVKRKLSSSYYFGLDWSGYTDGFIGQEVSDRLNEVINCEDTFYEFKYNKIYTVSSLIDQYKNGGRGRFIGIKEIDNDECAATVNKFPVNDAFKNFDLLFFIFSLLFQLFQIIGIPILIVAHLLLGIISIVIRAICAICSVKIPIINVRPFRFICNLLNLKCETPNFVIRLPMITYPNCETCACKESKLNYNSLYGGTSGVLSYLSDPSSYYDGLVQSIENDGSTPNEDVSAKSLIYAQAIAGFDESVTSKLYKTPKSTVIRFASDESDEDKHFAYSENLPLGERINIFNTRKAYFNNLNRIQVTFSKESNIGKYHFDNTITVLSNVQYQSGQLLTSVNPTTSEDLNFRFTAETDNGVVNGITGNTNSGAKTITVRYATSELSDQSVNYYLPTGSSIDRQVYPMDREYYQVITAITVSDAAKIWNTSNLQTLPNILTHPTKVNLRKKRGVGYGDEGSDTFIPLDLISNQDSQYILILQRGVDPYSPKYENEYRLGNIFGTNINDPNFTITTNTRINIPIQRLTNSNRSVQNMSQSEMFYSSEFFTPGDRFTGFTTSTVGYYGRIDSSYSNNRMENRSIGGVIGKVTKTSNDFYSTSSNSSKYDLSEDLSGASFMYFSIPFITTFRYKTVDMEYYSPNLYPILTGSPMNIISRVSNIMRTDRLPSSDALNGKSWDSEVPLLQQNNNFVFYEIPELDDDLSLPIFELDAEIQDQDIEDYNNNVINSFDCAGMVDLDCYEGFGNNFKINENCKDKGSVQNGCYTFIKRPLIDLPKDIGNFGEWSRRFRFFYSLCRGVLSQTFTNNWINGTLFAFPIQVDTYYDSQNKPFSNYSKDLIYFDEKTINFYYRSSPYNDNLNRFIGKDSSSNSNSVNSRNLLYPTTIMDLGYKDSFYSEIILEPETNSYIIGDLPSTTNGDNSDLINLFVISRITDRQFLRRLAIGDAVVNGLFSRNERRVDGDLAQLMSINSEIGVIKFSPDFYKGFDGDDENSISILGTPSNPAIAVWFSSTTENLQTKDYISPGRINYRFENNNFPVNYGIKSQVVPFYQWRLNRLTPIFGDQMNNWATLPSDIATKRYQSLDRTDMSLPTYFQSNTSPSNNDTYRRGYIFSVDSNGNYNTVGSASNKFIVGAPNHFYFGLIKGETSLDKFKRKYFIDE
jgi:hypothetical protein